jgi:feruloyl-CoA synthase
MSYDPGGVERLELDWQPSPFAVDVERRMDGCTVLRPRAAIAPYPRLVTDPLEYWAAQTPERTCVARRGPDGTWQRVSYAEALERVRNLAPGLLSLNLSAERPLLIISGNDIEHLLLGLAAMYVGVPYCPVSPAYSQASSDLSKLRYVVELLTPGLVAAFGGKQFSRAIATVVPEQTPVLGDNLTIPRRRILRLEDLAAQDLDRGASAHRCTGPDTIAKFLITSGSAGYPKPVITTQRMLCSNQIMVREALPFVVQEPPILVDWLPWSHTFGGSHNVGLVLFNGGTLYIDDGRPTPSGFVETLRNLRELSPTVYFNVPKGFDLLAAHLPHDAQLRRSFYRQLRACFFAGAGLSQSTWDVLDSQALAAGCRRVPIISGLGATETSPSVTFTTPENDRAGVIGRPAAGNVIKLVPVANKLELRVKGPSVTPGYWRLPELTAAAFDEEGYYRLGDAVRFLDPDDCARGLVFDGRLTEDFKLASGTWVSVGPIRAQLVAVLTPLAQDVVIAGLNRDFIGILIVPDWRACAAIAGSPSADIDHVGLVNDATVRARCIAALQEHAAAHPGSSSRVERAVLLSEPLSLDHGEITDKGSVNQRAVLARRASLVEDLFRATTVPHVLKVE